MLHALLEIKSLELPVHLGITEEERQKRQKVGFDITVALTKAPSDEESDQLKDSVCYHKICNSVNKLVSENSFSLIEKLAADLLKELKKTVPTLVRLQVSVHKIEAPVSNLKGGVSYTCGDLFLGNQDR